MQRNFRHDSGGTSEGTSSRHGLCGCGSTAYGAGAVAAMIGLPTGMQIWIVAGGKDMRRGFVGVGGVVQTALEQNTFFGDVVVFCGRRWGLIKLLCGGGYGLCLFSKRLERGKFT